MTTVRETVKKSLSGVDFPVSKEQLVDYAENNGVDEGTVRALRAMPRAEYDNLGEVVSSVPLDRATEEGQSDADKARQDAQDKSGLAEHQRQTTSNPIVEEIGENRGS